MDWFLYDRDLRHERVNTFLTNVPILYPLKTPSGGFKMGTLVKNMLIISRHEDFVKDNSFLILLVSSQAAFTCPNSTTETLEKGANSVQSKT